MARTIRILGCTTRRGAIYQKYICPFSWAMASPFLYANILGPDRLDWSKEMNDARLEMLKATVLEETPKGKDESYREVMVSKKALTRPSILETLRSQSDGSGWQRLKYEASTFVNFKQPQKRTSSNDTADSLDVRLGLSIFIRTLKMSELPYLRKRNE